MKRSKFSLSNYHLCTADMGKLYPIGCFEVLPGDTVQQATTTLTRLQPMLAPIMHPIHMKIHHWFVPYRLLWDNWEDFITGGYSHGPNGSTAIPTFPTITKDFAKKSLGDYFGLFGQQEVSALPFRAYNLIYNEFYRDEDLQNEIAISTDDGSDSTTVTDIQPVSWRKDYFTTSRPWTQKGPEITIPHSGGSSGTMTLNGSNVDIDFYGSAVSGGIVPGISADPNDPEALVTYHTVIDDSGTRNVYSPTGVGAVAPNVVIGGSHPFTATYNNASGISINALRLATSLQRYEEARARYGSRYVEYLRYLGVRSSDARLQLPEYLGGGKQVIQVSEVLGTADNLGQLGGHGVSVSKTNRYRRFFEEHGVVISLMYIMPIPMYPDGTDRMWLRRAKEDFYQKELVNIGQQEVHKRELFGRAPDVVDGQNHIFGYQDRYDEYRHQFSHVSGDFRDTLDYWHLGRKFSEAPTLNADFISHEPSKRIFVEQTENEFLIMAQHSIQARRLLPKRSKPMIF